MFDAVLGQEQTRRRVGAGALLSILFHAGVLTGALWLSARAVAPHVTPGFPTINFRYPGPNGGARAPSAAPAAPAKAAVPKHAIAKHIIPSAPLVNPPVPVPADEAPAASEPTVGVPVGPDGSTGTGHCNGPHCASTGEGEGDGPPGKPGGGDGFGEVRMMPGMTPPILLSSVPIAIPADAREARIQGAMILDCRLDVTGAVSDCRVIKPLPFMDQAVISGLMQRHYAPVTFQGEPVTVRYIFNVKIVAP